MINKWLRVILTIFPAKIPQVSIFLDVFPFAILRNSGTRLPGIETLRNPALIGDNILDGLTVLSTCGSGTTAEEETELTPFSWVCNKSNYKIKKCFLQVNE